MKANNQRIENPVAVLRRALAQAQAALDEAEAQVSKYRHAIAILEDADDGIGAPADNGSARRIHFVGGTTLPVLRSTDTMAKAAASVLEAAGQALHIKEIARRMVAAGYKNRDAKKLRVNMNKTLDRSAASSNGIFTKPKPAIYGLREWGEPQQESLPMEEEAPLRGRGR